MSNVIYLNDRLNLKYSENYIITVSKITIGNYINIFQDGKYISSSDITLNITNIPTEHITSIANALYKNKLYFSLFSKTNQENIIYNPPSAKKNNPWWKFW